jgi:hypothetical protein
MGALIKKYQLDPLAEEDDERRLTDGIVKSEK